MCRTYIAAPASVPGSRCRRRCRSCCWGTIPAPLSRGAKIPCGSAVTRACQHSTSAPPGADLGLPPGAPTHARNAGAPDCLNQFWNAARSTGCSRAPRGLPKGGLPSTTSEVAVLGKLAEAMANARLHSPSTRSALPTLASRRPCSPIFRRQCLSTQAGCRAGFTPPFQSGQSRPVTEHRPPAWGQYHFIAELNLRSRWARQFPPGGTMSGKDAGAMEQMMRVFGSMAGFRSWVIPRSSPVRYRPNSAFPTGRARLLWKRTGDGGVLP